MPNCRVLSIQSHVVSGYVGNKSATFPLQVLGFEVDAINSVQFSNHTAYEHTRGQVLNADELRCIYEGLTSNNITQYSHLLTGYVGSESFLKEVLNVVKDLRARNPDLVYVCDPVLGDGGKYYVPETLLPIYREQLLPLADLITPNQFEAELLAEMKITSEKDALQAMEKLHEKGVKTVVITSTDLGGSDSLILLGSTRTGEAMSLRDESFPDDSDVETERSVRSTYLPCLSSSVTRNHQTCCVKVQFPKLDGSFTGTGDLFTSMLLAWTHRLEKDFKLACEKSLSAIQHVLTRTSRAAKGAAGEGNKPSVAQMELKLIQSIDDIRFPSEVCHGEILK